MCANRDRSTPLLTSRFVVLAVAAAASQVRMQSAGKVAAGQPKKYPNAFKAYGIIARCGS